MSSLPSGSAIRLREVLSPGTTTIAYSYDFGDDWQHTQSA
ncbi:IS1096 element passenger TnpR family protein [Novosphingobium pituita]|nr:hypothetical protein [Novosphingobium sp. IK01]